MGQEQYFKDDKILDKIYEVQSAPEANTKMMENYLAPLYEFADKSASYKDMMSNYHTLLWELNSGRLYDKLYNTAIVTELFGEYSLQKETELRFIDIKNDTGYLQFQLLFNEAVSDVSVTNIFYALDLTPENAINYFKKLGVKVSPDWRKTAALIQKNIFSVTKINDMNILKDFQSSILTAIDEGQTVSQFKASLEENMAAKGWAGTYADTSVVNEPWRLNLVYRMNLQNSYNQGRWTQAQRTKDTWQYLQFLSIIDKRTSTACKNLHLKVMRVDDATIKGFLPPGHFNCRRRFRLLNDDLVKSLGLPVSKGSDLSKDRNASGFTKAPGTITVDVSKYPTNLKKELKKPIPENLSDIWDKGSDVSVFENSIQQTIKNNKSKYVSAKDYDAYNKSLSPEVNRSLKSYKGSGYTRINTGLRNKKDNADGKRVANATTFVVNSPVIYRGEHYKSKADTNHLLKMKVGDIKDFDGILVSASTDPTIARDFSNYNKPQDYEDTIMVFYKINMPKKYKVALGNDAESEYVMHPETKFRVDKINVHKDDEMDDPNIRIIDVELTCIEIRQ